jgi:4-amino-4-deoxy-L-arabinose transferase-like glycosyltransferase
LIALRQRDLSLMLALFSAALALRAVIASNWQFDGLYGQDPYAYYDYAQALRGGQLPLFFWPLGYPLLLAGTFSIFGPSAAVGQGVSLLLGALIVVMVYLLARQVGGSEIGAALAALLIAICGQAIQSSIVIMADIPALAWAVLSAILLRLYIEGRGVRWLIAAAALLALASITRWLYLALFPAWLLTLWSAHQLRRRDLGLALLAAALILVPQILYSATSPYPVFDHAWVQGWSPENAFRYRFTNVDGEFIYQQINLLYYAKPVYDAYYLAPVFAPFALIGLWGLARRSRSGAVMIGAWILLPFLFLVGIPYQNIRFSLIVVPPVVVLAGLGGEIVWRRVGKRWLPRLVLIGLLIFGIALTGAAARDMIGTFLSSQQSDQQAVAWAVAQMPPDSRVYAFGLTLRLQHQPAPLNVKELYYESRDSLAAQWIPDHDDYLLANVWVIENQWNGRELQLAYHWLRDVRGLEEIGRSGFYQLFRIRG